MKYNSELTKILGEKYAQGISVPDLAKMVSEKVGEPVPERSIIAKLSSMGIYKRKQYLTKRGDVPIKKEEYIDKIAILLDVAPDLLESLEKVNKNVLAMLEKGLTLSCSNTNESEEADEISQEPALNFFKSD